MNERPDAALVAEALGGRREAFAALVRRYQDYAYGVAIGILSDFDLARDVVQEAFLCAYRDLRKLNDPARFGGWLHGIVRHTAHRALRELERVRSLAQQMSRSAPVVAPTPPPDQSAEEAERRDLVHSALERLTERNREAISLHYVDGLSYGDIAGFLGVTEATVLGRLQRGRAQLKKELWKVVERTFKEHELPDDFSAEIQHLLDAAAQGGWEQQQAANRLAEIGAPAVEPLCEALGDPRVPVRQVAARALCQIGDTRALRPIFRVLYAGDYWIGNVILRTGRVLAIPGVREELLRILDEGQSGEQYWAIDALAHATDDEEVYARLLAVFRDEQRGGGMRMHALSAVCRLRPEGAATLVTEALSNPENRRRSGWAWWIAVRDGYVLPIETCLAGFTRDVAPNSRRMAGHLVLRHGDKGREALENILRTGTQDHRAVAALVLARDRHPEAFEVLKTELLSGYQERKWQRIVARAVVQHYGEELTAWAETGGGVPDNRPSIAWALAKIHLASERGTAEDVFRYGPPSVRAATVRHLAREGGAAFLPHLRRCLREGRPRKVAQEAFWQIFRLRDAAEPVVLEMLESAHWTERKAAFCLLRRWHKLTPEQQARGKADPHIAVRHAARWHPSSVAAAAWHPKHRKRVYGTGRAHQSESHT